MFLDNICKQEQRAISDPEMLLGQVVDLCIISMEPLYLSNKIAILPDMLSMEAQLSPDQEQYTIRVYISLK
jgi:hypothetical protein